MSAVVAPVEAPSDRDFIAASEAMSFAANLLLSGVLHGRDDANMVDAEITEYAADALRTIVIAELAILRGEGKFDREAKLTPLLNLLNTFVEGWA